MIVVYILSKFVNEIELRITILIMNYSSLKEIIDHLEQFEKELGKDASVKQFSLWLYQNYYKKTVYESVNKGMKIRSSIDIDIARAVGTLNIHAKHYIKTALKGTPLISLHDFTFLASLMEHGDLKKTELISRNYSELSPGIEVIRRLIRKGVIEDFNDTEDRRSKRVRPTILGRQVFVEVVQKMAQVSQIVTGNLSDEEKEFLLPILHRLVTHHAPIWREDYGENLDAILKKYSKQ